jgi:hypothetical protein
VKYTKILVVVVSLLIALSVNANLNDGLPNKSINPGYLNPAVTQDNINSTICVPGWTKTIRPPSLYTNKLKLEQIKQYGYKDVEPKNFEEDHIVPLAISGHPSDTRNLWPQPRSGEWNSEKKDVLESFLHREVCKGTISLEEARNIFLTDWTVGYKKYITKSTPKTQQVD